MGADGEYLGSSGEEMDGAFFERVPFVPVLPRRREVREAVELLRLTGGVLDDERCPQNFIILTYVR